MAWVRTTRASRRPCWASHTANPNDEGDIDMKPMVIVGIMLALLGGFIVVTGGVGFGSHRSVMRVGDLQVSAEERHVMPAWVGGVAIVGGLLLVGAGVRHQRGA